MISGPSFIRQFAPAIGVNPQTLIRLAPEMMRAGQWARGVQGGHGSEPVTDVHAWNMLVGLALWGSDFYTPMREVPELLDLANQTVERGWAGPNDTDPDTLKSKRLLSHWTDACRPSGAPLTALHAGAGLIEGMRSPEAQELRDSTPWVDISDAAGITIEFGFATPDKREFVNRYELPMSLLKGRQLTRWFAPLLYPAACRKRMRIPFAAIEKAAELVGIRGASPDLQRIHDPVSANATGTA